MIRKIIGATVGTPLSPKKIEKELNPVKKVNGKTPDASGNVEVEGTPGPAGMHIGPEAPTDGQVAWIDTNEEPDEGEGGANFDIVAKPGQVIAVKAVDVEGKPKEYKAVDLPVAVQPDWNANEGEAGYIEGRTHFVDKKGVIHKLDGKYIKADWLATSKEHIDDSVIIPEQKLSGNKTMWSNRQMDIQPGIVYDVHINGVAYPCKATNSGGGIILGNNTALTLNDYPFCVYWACGTATAGMFYQNGTLGSSVYLKVTGHSWTEYNTLPEEFLPGCVVKSVNGNAPDENGNVEVGGSIFVNISAVNGYSCSTKVSELDALLDTERSIAAKITTDTGALFASLCSYETSANNSYGRIVMFALGVLTFTLTPTASGTYDVAVSGD